MGIEGGNRGGQTPIDFNSLVRDPGVTIVSNPEDPFGQGIEAAGNQTIESLQELIFAAKNQDQKSHPNLTLVINREPLPYTFHNFYIPYRRPVYGQKGYLIAGVPVVARFSEEILQMLDRQKFIRHSGGDWSIEEIGYGEVLGEKLSRDIIIQNLLAEQLLFNDTLQKGSYFGLLQEERKRGKSIMFRVDLMRIGHESEIFPPAVPLR